MKFILAIEIIKTNARTRKKIVKERKKKHKKNLDKTFQLNAENIEQFEQLLKTNVV